MARLHALAAADLVDDDRLGRPRSDADVGRRLELLVDIVTGKSDVPATVLAAVAHGELLTLAPFGTADGLVARAVSRLVTIASGLGPARSRRAGGVLDAPFRRLPGRGTRVRLRHTRRSGGVVGAECQRPAGGAREALSIAEAAEVAASKAKRATFRNDSARRPLARTPVTKRAWWVAWVTSASLRCATTATPPKGSSWSSALRNYAGPQHFCLFRGMCSAWVPGSVLGSLTSGDRAFSSGSALASPGFRASFVLRDPGHSKGQLPATRDRYRSAPATTVGVADSESEAAQQRVRQRARGQGAHSDRRGGCDGGARRGGNAVAQRHRVART